MENANNRRLNFDAMVEWLQEQNMTVSLDTSFVKEGVALKTPVYSDSKDSISLLFISPGGKTPKRQLNSHFVVIKDGQIRLFRKGDKVEIENDTDYWMLVITIE